MFIVYNPYLTLRVELRLVGRNFGHFYKLKVTPGILFRMGTKVEMWIPIPVVLI